MRTAAAKEQGIAFSAERSIPGMDPDRFKCKEDGSIWKFHRAYKRWVRLKPFLPCGPRGGSARVQFSDEDGRWHRLTVGHVILRAFGQPRPLGCEVWHEDGDPMNNALSNIRWAPKGTSRIGSREGLPVAKGIRPKGEACGAAVLREIDVLEARQFYRDGISFQDIADHFGVERETIRAAVTGRTWKHVPGAMKARTNKEANPRGGFHPKAKLTEGEVCEIKGLIREGLSMTVIARRFGVSAAAIRLIKIGKNWPNVAENQEATLPSDVEST